MSAASVLSAYFRRVVDVTPKRGVRGSSVAAVVWSAAAVLLLCVSAVLPFDRRAVWEGRAAPGAVGVDGGPTVVPADGAVYDDVVARCRSGEQEVAVDDGDRAPTVVRCVATFGLLYNELGDAVWVEFTGGGLGTGWWSRPGVVFDTTAHQRSVDLPVCSVTAAQWGVDAVLSCVRGRPEALWSAGVAPASAVVCSAFAGAALYGVIVGRRRPTKTVQGVRRASR